MISELKAMAEENRRLKRMYAEMSMQNDLLKRPRKKAAGPSLRKEMAVKAVASCGVSIALACRTVSISESCYHYERKLSDGNAQIADWLEKLTDNRRAWGFGLCFLYLRNLKGFGWSHKRVYRICCELDLNLRIKPKKPLKRDKPDALGGAGYGQPYVVDGFHGRSTGGWSLNPHAECAG